MKILKAVTKKLERISPKATEMAEPKIGKKAKNPIQEPRPCIKCIALSIWA